MKLKPLWQDIKDIVIYLVTEPFIVIFSELKDIWKAIRNKRVWIYAFGALFILFAFLENKQLMAFTLIMFFLTFVIQHVQERKWKEKARERWYKKKGMKKFKKKK